MVYYFLFNTLKNILSLAFFILKAFKDILHHFKFVNWQIGEFVVSFFSCQEQVTNRELKIVRINFSFDIYIFSNSITSICKSIWKIIRRKLVSLAMYTEHISICNIWSHWNYFQGSEKYYKYCFSTQFQKLLVQPKKFLELRYCFWFFLNSHSFSYSDLPKKQAPPNVRAG